MAGQASRQTRIEYWLATRSRRRRLLALLAVAALGSVAGAVWVVYLTVSQVPDIDRPVARPQASTGTSTGGQTSVPSPTHQPLGPSATPEPGGGVSLRISDTVLFDRDSAVLRPEARRIIEDLGRRLRSAPEGTVLVMGYTDNLGSAQRGLILSRQRAQAVVDLLADQLQGIGIRLVARGLGESNPVAPNDTEANRAKNRRVEIVYRAA